MRQSSQKKVSLRSYIHDSNRTVFMLKMLADVDRRNLMQAA